MPSWIHCSKTVIQALSIELEPIIRISNICICNSNCCVFTGWQANQRWTMPGPQQFKSEDSLSTKNQVAALLEWQRYVVATIYASYTASPWHLRSGVYSTKTVPHDFLYLSVVSALFKTSILSIHSILKEITCVQSRNIGGKHKLSLFRLWCVLLFIAK